MAVKINIYTNPAGLKHDTGPGHPESPARLEAVLSLFGQAPFDVVPLLKCREMELSPLLYAHSRNYIDSIAEMTPDEGYRYLDADVIMSPDTWEAAVTAANTLCRAVDDVMAGDCDRAFCAVRPPGHHAMPDQAMGFCFFGNVFIGARHAQEKYGIKRIAIIDFDVHHGNGTDAMTRGAEGIFFISSHQSPFYPGTGDPRDDQTGKILNIPLGAGAGSKEFRSVYEAQVFPALEEFRPELMMISAGFDAHHDDPLASLNLDEHDYLWVTEKLAALAEKYCGGRIISTLEGGYDLKALQASVAAHLQGLM